MLNSNMFAYLQCQSCNCDSCVLITGAGSVNNCVVCLGREARITLSCGHRCLCHHCTTRVLQQFGTCPLCRQSIRAPSVEGRRIWITKYKLPSDCPKVWVASTSRVLVAQWLGKFAVWPQRHLLDASREHLSHVIQLSLPECVNVVQHA